MTHYIFASKEYGTARTVLHRYLFSFLPDINMNFTVHLANIRNRVCACAPHIAFLL